MSTSITSPRGAALTALVFGALLPAAIAEPQPDFHLQDVNPDSIRAGQTISPRDYGEQIGVYYFGREW